MGATGMTVAATATGMDDDSAHVADKGCLHMQAAVETTVYAGSGWGAVRGQVLHEPDDTWTHRVVQGVVLFSSAHDADAFFTASAQRWPACSNRQYTYRGRPTHTAVWTVGPVSNTNGTLSATTTLAGGNSYSGNGHACQRALTVANNVAIDVTACSAAQSNAAVNIAHQIAAKVPT